MPSGVPRSRPSPPASPFPSACPSPLPFPRSLTPSLAATQEYVRIIMQAHLAHDVVERLGGVGALQFTDLNGDMTAFRRGYTPLVKRCDELEKKLKFFEAEVKAHGLKLEECGVGEFASWHQAQLLAVTHDHNGMSLLDFWETVVTERFNDYAEVKAQRDRTAAGVYLAVQRRFVIEKAAEFFAVERDALGAGAEAGAGAGAGVAAGGSNASAAAMEAGRLPSTRSSRGDGGEGGGGGGGGGAGGKLAASPSKQQQQQQHGQQKSGAGGGPAPPRGGAPMPPVDEAHEGHEGEEGAPSTCQFCGGYGPASESELDLHYWQDCPLLMSCARCQQVVEIATLQEHLLEECERHADFAACPTCGDALEAGAKFEAHVAARACRPQPEAASGRQRCPLCHEDIEAGKEGWLAHLYERGCAANPRNSGWRVQRKQAAAAAAPKAKGGKAAAAPAAAKGAKAAKT